MGDPIYPPASPQLARAQKRGAGVSFISERPSGAPSSSELLDTQLRGSVRQSGRPQVVAARHRNLSVCESSLGEALNADVLDPGAPAVAPVATL